MSESQSSQWLVYRFLKLSTKTLQKQTEYKQNFENAFTPIENLSYVRPSIYAKYSKAAYEKNKSMLSNYGATILR